MGGGIAVAYFKVQNMHFLGENHKKTVKIAGLWAETCQTQSRCTNHSDMILNSVMDSSGRTVTFEKVLAKS